MFNQSRSPPRTSTPTIRMRERGEAHYAVPGQQRRLPIPFVRSRIHPLFLVPIFLLGAYFSPFSSNSTPQPVYTGAPYLGEHHDYGKGAFLPPDAPALVRNDEDLGIKRAAKKQSQLKGKAAAAVERARAEAGLPDIAPAAKAALAAAARAGRIAPDGLAEEEEDTEWWDWEDDSDDTATAKPSYSYLVERDGYLYYPSSSAPLVTIDIPLAPRKPQTVALDTVQLRQKLAAAAKKLDHAPPPPPWHIPLSQFRRKGSVPQPVAKPLPPAVAAIRPLHPPLHPEAINNNRKPKAPAGGPLEPERGANGQLLGPNAAAMQRAAREGRPFRPERPADLVADARAKEVEEMKRQQRIDAAEARVQKWRPAVGDEDQGFSDDDDDDDDGPEEMALLDGEDDEQAILEALDALTPEQRAFLSPEELELIAAMEQERKDAKARALAALEAQKERDEFADDEEELAYRRKVAAEKPKPPVFMGKIAAPAAPKKGGVQKVVKPKAGKGKDAKKDGKRMEIRKRAVVPREDDDDDEGLDEHGNELVIPPPVDDHSNVADLSPDSPALPVPDHPHAVDDNPDTAVSSPGSSGSSPAFIGRGKDRLHPIVKLMNDAEEAWEDMLRRQSQTLEQAVLEYKRRYNRNPPLGFDKWWRYAMENRVILVDEYDQINDDIEPFLALPASEVAARAKALSSDNRLPHMPHTFTITVKDGSLSSTGPQHKNPRSEDMQDLMSEFAEVLPDMALTFSAHDEAMIAVSGESRAKHVETARRGKVLEKHEMFDIMENPGFKPWHSLCAPNATARRVASGRPVDPTPSSPSFVSLDHLPAMDLCRHPELQHQNGFTNWDGPRPYLHYPLFSWSKTRMHSDLLCAPLGDYFEDVGRDVTWESKSQNKILWRGSSSGTYHDKQTSWRATHRARLVHMTNDAEGELEVRYADPSASDSVRRFFGPSRDINHHYFDVAYAGSPTQCDQQDDTCDVMKHELRFADFLEKEEQNKFKYVLDVDGNGWSSRFHRLMSTRSAVLKSTIFGEWYSKRVMPWYHYIPIKTDYSDLVDVAAFFIGAPDGTAHHDALGKKIGENGKKWAETHWREADMAAYQFRLYLEYSRLVNRDDHGSHDFTLI